MSAFAPASETESSPTSAELGGGVLTEETTREDMDGGSEEAIACAWVEVDDEARAGTITTQTTPVDRLASWLACGPLTTGRAGRG